MSHYKIVCLITYLSVSPLVLTACSHTKPTQSAPVTLNKEALNKFDTKTLLDLFSFGNVMELMEAVVEKDANYNGPAHLHPLNKTMLQKTFLPHYFDALDKLHSNEVPPVKARFVSGKGDQTQRVKPVDLTTVFLFLGSGKKDPDESIDPKTWGSLTSRQLFTALEFPEIEKFGINITASDIVSHQHTTSTSQSDTHLRIEARDELDNRVYTLEMPIGTNMHEIKFTTQNTTETYRVEGMPTDAVQSIRVNNKVVFTQPVTTKISDTLRKKLDL